MAVVPAGNDQPIQFQKAVTIGEAVKKIKADSWAAVAATPTGDGNRVVKFRPSDALKRHVVEDTTLVDPNLMRVVWVKHWDVSKRPLSSLTEYIDQGPLLSMAYSERDKAVCIIFMHAHHARSFLQASASCVGKYGQSIFGGMWRCLRASRTQMTTLFSAWRILGTSDVVLPSPVRSYSRTARRRSNLRKTSSLSWESTMSSSSGYSTVAMVSNACYPRRVGRPL